MDGVWPVKNKDEARMYISLAYAHTHCRDIIHYVRTFWKNVFIDIAYLYASPRRADIMNYVPTVDVYLYITHVEFRKKSTYMARRKHAPTGGT